MLTVHHPISRRVSPCASAPASRLILAAAWRADDKTISRTFIMLKHFLAVAAAVVFFAPTIARAEESPAQELKELEGEWKEVELQAHGKILGPEDKSVKKHRWTFKDNELVMNGRRTTFTVKSPKDKNAPNEIDILSLDGRESGTTTAGIYKFDKDQLVICMPYYTNDRSQ